MVRLLLTGPLALLAAAVSGSPAHAVAGCPGAGSAGPAYCVDLTAGGFQPSRLTVTGTVSVYFHNSTSGFVLISADGGRYLSNPVGPGQTSTPFTPAPGTNQVSAVEQDGRQAGMVIVDSPARSPTPAPSAGSSGGAPSSPSPTGPAPPGASPTAAAAPDVAASPGPPGRPASRFPSARRGHRGRSRRAAGARAGPPAPGGGSNLPTATGPGFTGPAGDPVGLPAAVAAVFVLGSLSAVGRVLLAEVVDERQHGFP
jgi:hypothetical protein